MQNTALKTLNNFTQFELSNLIFDSDLFEKVELKPTTRLVLITLCRYYPNIFPSMETIMKKAGIGSKETINNALKELKIKGLIIYCVDKNKKSNNYKFTPAFFELLKTVPDQYKKHTDDSTEIVPNKTNNNINKKQDFSFKNLLELSKTNTVAYYQQILNLTESEKEKLVKIKLGRMDLTSFQKNNLNKFIMLTENEIKAINNKEPYFKQENIDIYYNARIKKIKEYEQEPPKNEDNTPKSERGLTLSMLACGYKTFNNNKLQLTTFLARNQNKMEQYKITEAELINYCF